MKTAWFITDFWGKMTMTLFQDAEVPFPAVELHFDYISKAKRRRCYVLLDDDPQQAAKVSWQKNPKHVVSYSHTHTHTHTHMRFMPAGRGGYII